MKRLLFLVLTVSLALGPGWNTFAAPANPESTALPGVIVNQAGPFNAANVTDAFRIAKEAGAKVTRQYIHWGAIEKSKGMRDWDGNDWITGIARSNGLRLSTTFLIIRTAVLGQLPSDVSFRGWEDSLLVSRFTDFVLDYIGRYSDVIDYVEIGAEVNAYFERHPGELIPYARFYKQALDAIHQTHPNVKVGTVLSYRELRRTGDLSVYDSLSFGDFVGFTVYPHGDNFSYDGDPFLIRQYLDEISSLVAGKSFAIEEAGWSPWPSLGGTEAKQAAAIGHLFDFMDSRPTGLLFANWFILHDGQDSDCDAQARSFLGAGNQATEEEIAIIADFFCHMGLRSNDGVPREAFDVYASRANIIGVENPYAGNYFSGPTISVSPNPFTPTTTIHFQGTGPLDIRIYDLNGHLIRDWSARGSVVWDGRNSQQRELASGTYIVRGNIGNRGITKRIILMR